MLAVGKVGTGLLLGLALGLAQQILISDALGQALTDKKDVGVLDSIQMTRLADPDYFVGAPSTGKVATFSPDGKHFVVVLRAANMTNNTNRYSIYIFQTARVSSASTPDRVVSMESSSNRPGISQVRWLPDNDTLTFLGEDSGEPAQIYAFRISEGHCVTVTSSSTPIVSYTTDNSAYTVLYLASPSAKEGHDDDGVAITDQGLGNLLTGHLDPDFGKLELFVQAGLSSTAVRVPIDGYPSVSTPLSLSPDGRYGVVGVLSKARDIPKAWRQYEYPESEKDWVRSMLGRSELSTLFPFQRYFLVNVPGKTSSVLWDAPQIGSTDGAVWSPDSQYVFLNGVCLPVDAPARESDPAPLASTHRVRLQIRSHEWSIAGADEGHKPARPLPPITVSLDEDINTPPKIYVANPASRDKHLLLDLNPQMSELRLGRVETVTWNTHGIPVIGGLYLPPSYRVGKRYPLVIQTHGYQPDRFSMDGRSEWSSAFAARTLAAQGIMVLQAYQLKDPQDHDRIGDDKTLASTSFAAYRNFNALVFDAAIDYLNRKGMIDPDRVGISGFSRTVWFVAYSLTHSKTKYRAASLTDGLDGGYFQYIAYQQPELELDNGGLPPFDRDGMKLWERDAPGFNLAMVHTPVRLLSLDLRNSLLTSWEWFAGLRLQDKPVDLVALRDGSHLLERPRDREIAMDGMVNWFRFWLQGYERANPKDPNQYKRWEHLRNLQDVDEKATAGSASKPK